MNRMEDRKLPVRISRAKARSDDAPPASRAPAPPVNAAYAAQLYGQPGQKRGLRGGAPVLHAARTAYLEAEYSGEYDRRPPRGAITRTAF